MMPASNQMSLAIIKGCCSVELGLAFEVMQRLQNFLSRNTAIPNRCSIDTAYKSAYTTEFLDTLNNSQ
jgi:hypothetical protein